MAGDSFFCQLIRCIDVKIPKCCVAFLSPCLDKLMFRLPWVATALAAPVALRWDVLLLLLLRLAITSYVPRL